MRDHEEDNRGPGFNRRDFLRGTGATVAATALVTGTHEGQAADDAKKGVAAAGKAQDLKLKVNGKDVAVKVENRVTLLEVLRDELQLTGCKEVCDTTNCGACTVMIDGKAVYACARLAIECEGKDIKTVESLRNGDSVDPVITGFCKHDGMQCGFCTPGFVVATRAFLNQKPNASLDEIRKGLGGNLCRCGTYVGITACAVELAKKGGA